MRTPKGVPPLPPAGGDGNGMDHRVTIGRYIVCSPEGLDDPDNIVELTPEEEAEVLATVPPVSPDFKGWVETPDWIVWEGVDGTLHVANGRNSDGGILGDVVEVPRAQ